MIVDRDELKRAAALRAIEEVEDGMVLGLGTGSTAAFVVEGLAARVAAGLRVVGIPTSERTAAQARGLGIPIATFAEYQRLDMTIDGADEVELGSLNLIKGLGGALLREKIVAAASRRLVIVVDQEKLVERLGEHTPVPVEVTQFGWQTTAASLTALGCISRAPLYAGRAALCHRWRQLHPRLPVRANPRSGRARGAHRDDRRHSRERAVCRAQLGRRRRLGHRGRGLDPTPEEPGMRKVSLVVSDVDGTLVTTDKALTPRAIAAVARLHERGIHFSICSSRPPFGQRMLIEPLRLALPFGGYNGGSIVNPDLSPVEQKLLAPDAARDTVALLEEHGVTSIWVFTGGAWLIRDRAGDYVDLEIHTIQTPPTLVPSLDGHLDAVSKIVGASKDHDRIAAVVAAGQAALRGRASVMRSQAYYCDVTPPGIDKGRLVDLLAERLAVPREEIAVLGDMGNDVEMFRRAGFPIAMGNATPEVKALAQAVTLSNDEDGFAVAIERHVLGD